LVPQCSLQRYDVMLWIFLVLAEIDLRLR
jgi:hypothetical protein